MKTVLIGGLLILAAAGFAAEGGRPLYENNFENVEAGKLPDEFLSLNGDFVVKAEGTNKFLELPGAPLDTFAVLFGPTQPEDVAVSARIFGTAKGRRYPTFGVGLGGVAGYRLQVSPGKKTLEIYKDADLKADVPYEWKPGEWTSLRLEIAKTRDGEWTIKGQAATVGVSASETLVKFVATEQPHAGRASVSGSPFSGTPIWFDDLVVERVGK